MPREQGGQKKQEAAQPSKRKDSLSLHEVNLLERIYQNIQSNKGLTTPPLDLLARQQDFEVEFAKTQIRLIVT